MLFNNSTNDNFLETNTALIIRRRAIRYLVPFYRRSVSRNTYYAVPRTHCTHLHNFRWFHACTTNGPTVYKAGDTDGWWGMETNARRLGCRFIGRKILDLLISLVRHVGFVLLPVGIGWRGFRIHERIFLNPNYETLAKHKLRCFWNSYIQIFGCAAKLFNPEVTLIFCERSSVVFLHPSIAK